MKKLISFWIASLLLLGPAQAQDPTDYDRALAAGYKAQFICSGLWNGGKSLTDIEADELTGIYERVADIVPTLTAEIDRDERQVRVKFSEDMPPRTALWNRRSGCTSMPIGFGGIKTGKIAKSREFNDDRPWPMGDIIPQIRAGKQITAVRAITDSAFDAPTYGAGSKTSGVLIIHKGRIIAERYKDGHDLHTAQRTWSVAKSIAGTLIGHSVQNELLDVNKPAPIAEWSKFGDPRAYITLDNLMRMSSGLASDTPGNRTDAIYLGGTSVTDRATGWPLLYKPGTRFRYANNDTLLAVHAAQRGKFDPYRFFQKLGMTRTYAETDWQDNYILSSQVWSTARDLGRLGMLYLNNGMWEEERLLPENWRAYVSSPSGPQPDSPFGYGATFWLMNNIKGIPDDTFGGLGNRGQYLVIMPSLDLIIVRRGYDTRTTRFDIAAFTKDIVKALRQ